MDILKNLNHRLMVDSDSVGVVPGGEEYIKEDRKSTRLNSSHIH